MGTISFSLYLLHYPIIKAVHGAGLIWTIPGRNLTSGLLTAGLIVLPLSILAATLTYYVIEKPPLSLRKQYATFKNDKEPVPVASGSDA